MNVRINPNRTSVLYLSYVIYGKDFYLLDECVHLLHYINQLNIFIEPLFLLATCFETVI